MSETKVEVLKRTVEEQNGKITMYQTKLRDLVVAYKDLQKEKAALEASLNALSLKPSQTSSTGKASKTPSKTEPSTGVDKDDSKTEESADGVEAEETSAEDSAERKEENEEFSSLKEQLATLTQSLATVTQQRSKLEANYVAEKKKLKQDLEEMELKMEETTDEFVKQIQELQSELDTSRSKSRNQQHLHDKESDDYALMIKELQQLVSTERLAKEHLESQLDDLQTSRLESESIHQRQIDELKKCVRDLTSDVERLQREAQHTEKQSKQPSEQLIKLQKELVDAKISGERSVQLEQQKVAEMSERLMSQSRASEHRISELENRLSELSDNLGAAERSRVEDQRIITRLKERISQLDQENSALTQISNNNKKESDTENLDLSIIIERLQQLTEQFYMINAQSDKHLNLFDLLSSYAPHEADPHSTCKEQYEQLREEYEKYKLRAQAALRNSKPSAKEGVCSDKEFSTLKASVSELKEKLNTARTNNEELGARLRDKEEGFIKAITALKESHTSSFAALESTHRQKLSDVEMEMRKHRERTVALLAEKDGEISSLKYRLTSAGKLTPPISSPNHTPSLFDPSPPEAAGASSGSDAGSEAPSVVQELLARHSGDSSSLIHYAQERGRLDVEIASLRKQKRDLESALREVQQVSVMRTAEWEEHKERLLEMIDKEKRDRSREGANLEYLKNIVYRYMICTDPSGRSQIAKAISTILEFSTAERKEVMTSLKQGWWPVTKL